VVITPVVVDHPSSCLVVVRNAERSSFLVVVVAEERSFLVASYLVASYLVVDLPCLVEHSSYLVVVVEAAVVPYRVVLPYLVVVSFLEEDDDVAAHCYLAAAVTFLQF